MKPMPLALFGFLTALAILAVTGSGDVPVTKSGARYSGTATEEDGRYVSANGLGGRAVFPKGMVDQVLKDTETRPKRAAAAGRPSSRPVTKEDYLQAEDLLAEGKATIYRGESLAAVSFTVGGIGSGCIQIDGHAVRRHWQIFNNIKPVAVPDSFFAIRAGVDGGPACARVLQTRPVEPLKAMRSLELRGEYPFAWYAFKDDKLPVKVEMETYNFLIPMDAKNSALPCAVFSFTVTNPAGKDVSVSLLGTQQNACELGLRGGGAQNKDAGTAGAAVLHLKTPLSGDMALMVMGEGKVTPACKRPAELLAGFGETGSADPAEGSTLGAVVTTFTLRPGQSRTSTFVLTWHFPGARQGDPGWKHWSPEGCRYEHWWKNALEVAAYVRENFTTLSRQTRLFHDTLYESNLPYWMRDRISSPLAVLKSKTVFWSKDGYFGGWEGLAGSKGCCGGSCTHVWHYAQAYAYLYPELGRKMREIELSLQAENGALPHRMKAGYGPAADGMCGSILSIYRGHLLSSDGQWLQKVWPATRKAMDWFIRTWDGDKDGVLSGAQWNTLDCACGGSSSWLGSMYLAALTASEKMAMLMNENETAEAYRKIRLSGQKKQDETLFNGEYYFQIPDPKPQRDYGTGCHIDQALGVWWSNQLDLGWLYPKQHVCKAMESLFRYNFHADFTGRPQHPRKFVADGDAGMQMITWPKGGQPPAGQMTMYASEVMSGFEYAAAAAMIQCGLVREGFAVVKAAHDRYDGRLRTGLKPGPDTSGNPFGDDECGRFYARTMSAWSLLLACQGFTCDGPAGVIGFRPVWRPADHRSFFSTAEGWGLFTQRRGAKGQSARIELRYGKLRIRRILLEALEGTKPTKVELLVAGRPAAAEISVADGQVTATLKAEAAIEAPAAVEITLN